MKVWAIRRKGTSKYLQLHKGANTCYEESDGIRIRFHPTKRGAVNTLSVWLKGSRDFIDHYSFTKKPDRKREEMEIVEFDLTEISVSQLKSK